MKAGQVQSSVTHRGAAAPAILVDGLPASQVLATPDGWVEAGDLEPGDPVIAGQTVVARMTPVDPDFLDPRTEARARAQVQALELVRRRDPERGCRVHPGGGARERRGDWRA